MSQYLSFKLINKINPEIKVDLGYWCTSIARGICDNFNNIFQYTEKDVNLDIEDFKSYIEELHIGIDEYKQHLHEYQEKNKKNIELLLKAQSKVVVEVIKEDIENFEISIADWQEEIDTWEMVENKLNFIFDIFNKNKNEWKLVYKNS